MAKSEPKQTSVLLLAVTKTKQHLIMKMEFSPFFMTYSGRATIERKKMNDIKIQTLYYVLVSRCWETLPFHAKTF